MNSGAEIFRFRGHKLVGVMNRPDRRRFPAVLFLHGFPGSEKNVDIQREFLRRGIGSFAPHFCGAWGSEGFYRFTTLVDQARAALAFLRGRPGVDARRLAVFGFSMGGWTALHLGAREPSLRAVAAVAPVGGTEMLSRETPGFIVRASRPLRVTSPAALSRDFVRAVRGMDPARSARRLTRPLLLVHGDADDVVPPEVSRRVSAAAAGPCRLLWARGAGHSFLDRRPWLTRRVADWLERAIL